MLLAMLVAPTTSPSSCFGLKTVLRLRELKLLLNAGVLAFLLFPVARAESQIPASIRLHVVEGDDSRHTSGALSYRQLSVKVTLLSGDPVAAARVTFQLPAADPTGTFPNGTRIEEVLTDGRGIAAVWGIKWGAATGLCNVIILAKVGTATAGTVARVQIAASDRSADSIPTPQTSQPSWPAFEVAMPSAPPTPLPRAELELGGSQASNTAAPPIEPRPGVLLTKTTNKIERLPNPWVKRALIILAVAGGAGGWTAYKFLSKQPPVPVVTSPPPTPLTLGQPVITIGKP